MSDLLLTVLLLTVDFDISRFAAQVSGVATANIKKLSVAGSNKADPIGAHALRVRPPYSK